MKRSKILIFIILFQIHVGVIAQWEQTNGPYIETISCYFSHENDTIFAGTNYSGVYLTTNNGDSWIPFSEGLTNLEVAAFTKHASIIFASTEDGVYKLSYENNTWVHTDNGLPNYIISLASDSTKIFACSRDNVYLSTDKGNSWTEVNSGLPADSELSILVIKDSTVFLGTYGNGVFASNTNMINWHQTGQYFNHIEVLDMVVFENTVYVGTKHHGLFKMTDEDNNWINIADVNLGVTAIAVNEHEIFFGTGGGGVFHSSDGGNNWQQANDGIPSHFAWEMHINNAYVFVGSNRSGNYRSNIESINWSQKNIGFRLARNYVVGSNGSSLYAGTDGRGLFSYDPHNDNNWRFEMLNGFQLFLIATANDKIYIGAPGGTVGRLGVYLSIDNGESWQYIKGSHSDGVIALASDPKAVIIGEEGEFNKGTIYISTDDGEHWFDITNDLPISYDLSTLLIKDSTIYVALEKGVYFSSDFGQNWILRNNGIPSSTYCNSFIEFKNQIFASTSEGVFYTDNQGIDWVSANHGLTDLYTHCFASNDTSLFVGTSNGIFYSSTPTKNWIDFSEGFPSDIETKSLAIYNNYIYSATWYNGIWKRNLTSISSIEVDGSKEKTISIYPNPANRYITIKTDVSISIYKYELLNLNGQIIIESSVAENKINIDISHLKKGIYFVKISSEIGVSMNKFIKY